MRERRRSQGPRFAGKDLFVFRHAPSFAPVVPPHRIPARIDSVDSSSVAAPFTDARARLVVAAVTNLQKAATRTCHTRTGAFDLTVGRRPCFTDRNVTGEAFRMSSGSNYSAESKPPFSRSGFSVASTGSLGLAMLGGLLLASPSQAGERNFKIPAPRAHLVVLAPRLSVSGTVAAYLLQKHLAALQPAKTARCYLLPRYRQQLAKPTDAPEPQHDWLGKTAVKEQNLLLLDGLGGAFSLRSLFRATRRVHALRLVGESATGHRAFGGVAAATEYGDPILRKIFDGASKPEPRGQTPIHLCDLGPEAGGTIAKVWRKIAPGQPLPEWAELLTQAAEQPFSATDAHALREALFTRFNGSEAVGDHWIGRTRPRRGRRRAQSGRAGANGQKRSEGYSISSIASSLFGRRRRVGPKCSATVTTG
jgi:hypothetical protein